MPRKWTISKGAWTPKKGGHGRPYCHLKLGCSNAKKLGLSSLVDAQGFMYLKGNAKKITLDGLDDLKGIQAHSGGL